MLFKQKKLQTINLFLDLDLYSVDHFRNVFLIK